MGLDGITVVIMSNLWTAGSMWHLEDQMRALPYQSTMAGFEYSIQQADVSNLFGMRQEDIQYQRMQASNEYSRWQRGFDYQGQLMQRGWAREDWEYQDTMRGLNFGWSMEDINEAIRYSSGRERQRLIRQRDRLSTSYNLEGEQVDEQRQRQEELWAREDERYEKQTEYAEQLIQLDIDQFNLSKEKRETFYHMDRDNLLRQIEEYQRQKDLQDEITQKNREY